MNIGLFSDIHVHRYDQAEEIAALVAHINQTPNLDLLLCAGDLSHHSLEIEAFFRSITVTCVKAWVPGNHDIWVIHEEVPGDSADVRYVQRFPQLSNTLGWHYLPSQPLLLPEAGLALVGSMGWFTDPGYSEWYDTSATHADHVLAQRLAMELEQSILAVPSELKIGVVTHHVPHPDCLPPGDPRQGETSTFMAETLLRHRERLALVLHGHKHRRYGPRRIHGIPFVAHPFGYPRQHASPADGFRVLTWPDLR